VVGRVEVPPSIAQGAIAPPLKRGEKRVGIGGTVKRLVLDRICSGRFADTVQQDFSRRFWVV